MKILKIVTIALLIIVLLLATSFFLLRSAVINMFGLDYIGDEALIQLFNENFTTFSDCAKDLTALNISNNKDESLYIESFFDAMTNGSGTKKYANLKHGLWLRTKKGIKIEKDDIKRINDSKASEIMKNLDFEYIKFGKDWVYFTNRSLFRNSAGILYFTGEEPHFVFPGDTLEKLKDNWYYYFDES